MHDKRHKKMMRRFGRLSCAGFLLLQSVWPLSLAAQQRTVELDPAKTQIRYVLGATAHTVHGIFQLKSGVINFDPATGLASGAIIVYAASGNSGTDGRDKKMDKDVLETEQYHDIVFYPKKVTGSIPSQGASQIQAQGIFRLRG